MAKGLEMSGCRGQGTLIASLSPVTDGVLENFGNRGMPPSGHVCWERFQETVRTVNRVDKLGRGQVGICEPSVAGVPRRAGEMPAKDEVLFLG